MTFHIKVKPYALCALKMQIFVIFLGDVTYDNLYTIKLQIFLWVDHNFELQQWTFVSRVMSKSLKRSRAVA